MVANNFTDIEQLESLEPDRLKFWSDMLQKIADANEKYMKKNAPKK